LLVGSAVVVSVVLVGSEVGDVVGSDVEIIVLLTVEEVLPGKLLLVTMSMMLLLLLMMLIEVMVAEKDPEVEVTSGIDEFSETEGKMELDEKMVEVSVSIVDEMLEMGGTDDVRLAVGSDVGTEPLTVDEGINDEAVPVPGPVKPLLILEEGALDDSVMGGTDDSELEGIAEDRVTVEFRVGRGGIKLEGRSELRSDSIGSRRPAELDVTTPVGASRIEDSVVLTVGTTDTTLSEDDTAALLATVEFALPNDDVSAADVPGATDDSELLSEKALLVPLVVGGMTVGGIGEDENEATGSEGATELDSIVDGLALDDVSLGAKLDEKIGDELDETINDDWSLDVALDEELELAGSLLGELLELLEETRGLEELRKLEELPAEPGVEAGGDT